MEVRNSNGTIFLNRSKIYREIQLLGNLQACTLAGTVMMILMFGPIAIAELSSVVVFKLSWIYENAVIIAFSAYISITCITYMIYVVWGQARLWADSTLMFQGLAN